MSAGTATNCLTNFGEQTLLNTFRGTPPATVANWYIALFTVQPNQSATGTEVVGNNYGRALVTFGAPSTNVNGNMQIANTNLVQFLVASAAWGNIVGWALMDASINGNIWATGQLLDLNGNPITIFIGANQSFSFQVGHIVIPLQ